MGSSARLTASEAMRFAERLAGACSHSLDDLVDGVVLHGSLALGDYTPGRSDIDLLVVVARPLADGEVAALTDAVAADAAKVPIRVDLRVVTREVAASPTATPPMELAIEARPRGEPPVCVVRRRPGERDLAVELSICRAIGRSIAGRPATSLIAEVPAEWVVAAGDAQLAEWQAIGDDPRYAQLTVLTACRIWRFAEELRHCSKTAAAEWALENEPSLAVVQAALRQRDRDAGTSLDPTDVQLLLRLVRERIRCSPDLVKKT